ncbi:MAG: hypothetical protein AAFQ37_06625 [Bacteroidota bacterium]
MKFPIIYLLFLPFFLPAQATGLLLQLTGAEGIQQYKIVRKLQRLPLEDFTEADRDQLADLLVDPAFIYRDQLMLLAGYLQMGEALRNMPTDLYSTEKLRRSHGLALVRAGDERKTQQLVRKIKRMPYDDTFTYDLVPLLIYTHSRPVYDHLIELILEANNNCKPADPHAEGAIDCGYRLMEYLAPVLVDYPFKVGSSGDLEVDDYRAALDEVRTWLRRHRKDYQIVTNQF